MGFLTFVSFAGLAFLVLQIILFFKLWSMTDNVAKMLKIMERNDPHKENWFD